MIQTWHLSSLYQKVAMVKLTPGEWEFWCQSLQTGLNLGNQQRLLLPLENVDATM